MPPRGPPTGARSRLSTSNEIDLTRDLEKAPPESVEARVLAETRSDLRALISIPDAVNEIVVLERKTGFFSLVFIVLSYLAVAEKRRLRLRVHFGRDCLYADQSTPAENNAWDQFFEPLIFVPDNQTQQPAPLPSRASLESACDTGRTLENGEWITRRNPALAVSPGRVDEKNRAFLGGLLQRFVRPRPHVLKAVDTFVRDAFAGRAVIGVHARGNEHDSELAFFRFARLPLEAYFSVIDRESARLGASHVFLATDQRNLFEAFKQRYGERLLTFDAQRCDPGQSLHYNTGGARVGFDVLCECLILSRCSHLVHGISNVPAAACYFTPSLPHTNIYEHHRRRARFQFEYRRLRSRCVQRLREIKLGFDRWRQR
ncbi:MAG: nodulation protein NodZ [Nibricoccus sp.]